MRTAALLLGLLSCSGGDSDSDAKDPKWAPRSVEDEGTVCITGEADAKATVVAWSPGCFSSSCDRNETGSCTATFDGTTITVTTTFSWETATAAGYPCTDDCGSIQVSCGEVGPLSAGSWDVVLGADQSMVTIPNQGCDPF